MSQVLAYFSAHALWPQLTIASGVFCALASGMLRGFPAARARLLSVAALVIALWVLAMTPTGAAGPLVRLDALGKAWQFLFYGGTLLFLMLLSAEDEVPLALTLGSVLGMGLIAVSSNFLFFFVGLELMSVPAYLLVSRMGNPRKPGTSLEAAVKYFFAGGVAGGLYLLGLALYYSASGTLAGIAFTSVAQTAACTLTGAILTWPRGGALGQ